MANCRNISKNNPFQYKKDLTASVVRSMFLYNSETGEFKKRKFVRPAKRRIKGYRNRMVHGRVYREHRLIWLHHYGEWPSGIVDHANGIKTDNRIANLRLATLSNNRTNSIRCRRSKSGLKGVTWMENGKVWRARIETNKKVYHLGLFKTKEAAHAAYWEAAKRLHGEFARAG